MVIRRTGGLFEERLTESVIGGFLDVYWEMGCGFVETVYLPALELELRSRGHSVVRELAVRVMYKGQEVAWQRLDMVVDEKLVVEVKATEVLPPTAERQLNNYLRATDLELGLLLHFGPKPFVKRAYVPNQGSQFRQFRPSDQSEEPLR